ncbi:MAG: DUF3052 domain-containing protein [Actinomycetota bacterium]|nr:DUF3052 domain-containing protein [Actinomycetota bacterium]
MPHKDYSGTPLYKKLGIKEETQFGLAGLEIEEFLPIIGELPPGVEIMEVAREPLDVLVMFATGEKQLRRRFHALAAMVRPDGGFWVAYPKKSSSIETNLTFDIVQEVGLGVGLVDNKTCAIDENWSGVRFVMRLKDRPKAAKAAKAAKAPPRKGATKGTPRPKAATKGTRRTK